MMFWIITASVLVGMILGTCVGVLVMGLMAMASRANEPLRVHDRR